MVDAGEQDTAQRETSALVRVARVGYLVVLGTVLAWLVWTRRGDIAELVTGTRPGWLVLALALGLVQLLPNVGFWTVTLADLRSPVPMRAVLSATARSVPARYLPGSVWYALGRATLLRREQGTSKRALGTAAILESALGVVVAIALGTALLASAGRFPGRGPWLALWFVVLGILGSPPAINAVLRFVARRRGGEPQQLSWRGWSRLVAITVVHWGWSATTFTVYLHAFPALSVESVAEVAGSFLVAWVVGFLAIFAPQGLGVFEASVAALLTTANAPAAAVVVAGYRALILVRDVVAFGAASFAERGR